MGPSQGKTSNLNGVRIVAAMTGRPSAWSGDTPRPFVRPVPMGQLAGRRLRRSGTPLDGWHRAHGAHMKEAGTGCAP